MDVWTFSGGAESVRAYVPCRDQRPLRKLIGDDNATIESVAGVET